VHAGSDDGGDRGPPAFPWPQMPKADDS